jgi:hypothetical protein
MVLTGERHHNDALVNVRSGATIVRASVSPICRKEGTMFEDPRPPQPDPNPDPEPEPVPPEPVPTPRP